MSHTIEEEKFDRVKEIEKLMESVNSGGFPLELKKIFENFDLENEYKVIATERWVDIYNNNIIISTSYMRDIDKEKFTTNKFICFFDDDKVLKVQNHIKESLYHAYDYFKKHDEYKKLTVSELIKLIKPVMKKVFLDPLAKIKLREFEKKLEESNEKYKVLDEINGYHSSRFLEGSFYHIYKIIREKECGLDKTRDTPDTGEMLEKALYEGDLMWKKIAEIEGWEKNYEEEEK